MNVPATLIYAPLVLVSLTLALAAPVLLRLYRKGKIEEITPEWLESFSIDSYYPMQHLLSKEDFQFLARQPGFDLSLYRKLRRERLHVFRLYLKRMIGDFNRLHLAARILIAHGAEDRSDLIARLFWLKARFSFAVLRAEASYVLCLVGFRSLAVNALILRLDEMSTQLTLLSSPQAA